MEENKIPNISSEVELVTLLNKFAGLLPPSSPRIIHHLIYYPYVLILIIVAWTSHHMHTNCHLGEYHVGYVKFSNSIGFSWLIVFVAYALRERHAESLERAVSVIKEVDNYLINEGLSPRSSHRYWNAMYAKYLFFVLHPIPIVNRILNEMFVNDKECKVHIVAFFFMANVTFVVVIFDMELRQFTSVITGIGKRYCSLTTHILSLSQLERDDKRLRTAIDMADNLLRAANIMNEGYSPILLGIIVTIFIGTITAITTIGTRLYRWSALPTGADEILRPSVYLLAWIWLMFDCILAPQQCHNKAKKFKSAVYTKMMENGTPDTFVCIYLARDCELKFEAWGLISLDNTFFVSMLSSVTGYCIVLLQLFNFFFEAYSTATLVNPYDLSLATVPPDYY